MVKGFHLFNCNAAFCQTKEVLVELSRESLKILSQCWTPQKIECPCPKQKDPFLKKSLQKVESHLED